jgi:hypothetical protein
MLSIPGSFMRIYNHHNKFVLLYVHPFPAVSRLLLHLYPPKHQPQQLPPLLHSITQLYIKSSHYLPIVEYNCGRSQLLGFLDPNPGLILLCIICPTVLVVVVFVCSYYFHSN